LCHDVADPKKCFESILGQLQQTQMIGTEQHKKCSTFEWSIGWCSVTLIDVGSSIIPFVHRPTDHLPSSLDQWNTITKDQVIEIHDKLQFKTSSVLEQLVIIAPATAIGYLISASSSNSVVSLPKDQQLLNSILAVRFGLAVAVTAGHAYQLCEVQDPLHNLVGIEISSVACCALFFMSGMGVSSSTNTNASVFRFLQRARRLWMYCVATLLLHCLFVGFSFGSTSRVVKFAAEIFIDWTATPNDDDIKQIAPSLWTVPYTIHCWFIMMVLTILERKTSASILCILLQLFSMHASDRLISFFVGALVAVISQELKCDVYLINWSRYVLAFIPWIVFWARPKTSGAYMYPFVFSLVLCAVQFVRQNVEFHSRKMSRTLTFCTLGLFSFSSTIQLKLISSAVATSPFWNFLMSSAVVIGSILLWNYVISKDFISKSSFQSIPIKTIIIICCCGKTNGHDMRAQVQLVFPQQHMQFPQYAEISTIVASECMYSKELQQQIFRGSVIERHQLCQKNMQSTIPTNISCSAWFSPAKNVHDLVTPTCTLYQAGKIELLLNVQFCVRDVLDSCAQTTSQGILIHVVPCEITTRRCNNLLATIEAVSDSLHHPTFHRFQPKFAEKRLDDFAVKITHPKNGTVFVLHQASIDFELTGANTPLLLNDRTIVCVDLRFNIYAKSAGNICTSLIYYYERKGRIIVNFEGVAVQNGLIYLLLCLEQHGFKKKKVCSKMETAIFANDNTYNPKFQSTSLTWKQLKARKEKNQKISSKVFMTFAYSKEYCKSAAVLGKSLSNVQSEYKLVVVIPLSSVKNGAVELVDIANLYNSVDRVVVVRDDIKNSTEHTLLHEFSNKVYCKLLALNFTEYDLVAVIDADSMILSSNIDLVFEANVQDFVGVGSSGIVPGSFFIVRPDPFLLFDIIRSLYSQNSYRLHEMGFLNVYFGAGSNIERERLPSTASCTAIGKERYEDCAAFDFSYCGIKPWETKNQTLLKCTSELTKKNLDHIWTRAVQDWKAIQHFDSQQNQTMRMAEAVLPSSSFDQTQTKTKCMTLLREKDTSRSVTFTVQLCAPRAVCVRTEKMSCSMENEGILEIEVQKATNSIGDQRIIIYCMTEKERQALTTLATHDALRKVSLSCGKIEHSFSVAPPMPSSFRFTDAQKYVSGDGGDGQMAMDKWEHSGKAQMRILNSVGLKPFHSVLEFGCGTLNLARHLLKYLSQNNEYHCIEPNNFLIESSIADSRPINVHNYNDFGALKPLPRTFDVIFAHSVLSHTGTRDWNHFFTSLVSHLSKNGVAIVSLCFCSPCEESPRLTQGDDLCEDSGDETWVYPYVSWWKHSTLSLMARKHGLHIRSRPDLRQIMIETSPADNHDWMSVTHRIM
jgi:SAM-dependent methyltransferase